MALVTGGVLCGRRVRGHWLLVASLTEKIVIPGRANYVTGLHERAYASYASALANFTPQYPIA